LTTRLSLVHVITHDDLIGTTPNTQRKKFPPSAKVFLVDEKLSNEKGQSLQHLLKVKPTQNLRKRNKRQTRKVKPNLKKRL